MLLKGVRTRSGRGCRRPTGLKKKRKVADKQSYELGPVHRASTSRVSRAMIFGNRVRQLKRDRQLVAHIIGYLRQSGLHCGGTA